MGSVLIGLLVDVVVIVVTALIAFAIGKQGRTTELVERESQIETLRHHLERKTQTIDYLRAECDHFQARTRKLEAELITRAHMSLTPVPPSGDIEQLGAVIHRAGVAGRRLDPLPDASAEALGLAVIKQKKET